MQLVCMDYLSLETSKGYSSVLIITDHFTKYAQAITTRNQSAKTTAKVLFDNFIVHYGIPGTLHSDLGRSFESKVIKELCILLGIEKTNTTPYHPQCNGICERFNKTLLNMLGTLPQEKKHKWPENVSTVTHAYNCSRHESTGFSPYELLFGRPARLPIDIQYGLDELSSEMTSTTYSEYNSDLRKRLNYAYQKACKQLQLAAQKQKHSYDTRVRGATLAVGDVVLVRKTGLHNYDKLADKWEEPLYVIKAKPYKELPVFRVKPLEGGRTRTLHRNLLLPVKTSTESTTVDYAESKEEGSDEEGEVLCSIERDDQSSYTKQDTVQDEATVTPVPEFAGAATKGSDHDNDQQSQGHSPISPPPLGANLQTDDSVASEATENINVPGTELPGQYQNSPVTDRFPQHSVGQEDVHITPPVPAPRRGTRIRRKPKWMTSGEYITQINATSLRPQWLQRGEYISTLLQNCPVIVEKPQMLGPILDFMQKSE